MLGGIILYSGCRDIISGSTVETVSGGNLSRGREACRINANGF